ncbi:transporter substrate-binding domain-containing protein [Roseovarius arcticus]|uniref:transporter substrate-binding domain-containing protein n=1 Tax=Roseovarius arcticus TaxID=2547404 RepID=UPI001110332B|nr:transporter substrate-binding domain-containing protein [Roseovarius arcticus]
MIKFATRAPALALALLFAILISPAPIAAQDTQVPQAQTQETQPEDAAEQATAETGPLIVATKHTPPFAFVGAGGEWSGIAIDAMTAIASDLGRTIEWREDTLDGMLAAVEDGEVDAAIAAITITPAREAKLDFTFPYYTTGLGIAINPDAGSGWFQVVKNLFTWQFAVAIATLSTVLLAAGAAVWAFERRSNEEFPRSTAQGLGDGFWWAAVTMTTVGYGDKSPRTLGGRIVGVIWMFTAMLIVASFTAAIAASLTVGSLGNSIQGVSDLKMHRVGVVTGTTGAEEMAARGIRLARYDSIEDGLQALLDEKIAAFVYDKPLMQYVALNEFESEVQILDDAIGRQDYGIALPTDSELREPMNRALLTYLRSDAWSRVLSRYLGVN